MDHTPPKPVTDPVAGAGPLIVSGTLYVALYDDSTLSVIVGNMERASKRMRFNQEHRGPAPADINPALPCVLWYAAQLVDDAFHAPW